MDLHRTLHFHSISMDSSRIISSERQIVQRLGLIWMSLVRRGLIGVIVVLWHTFTQRWVSSYECFWFIVTSQSNAKCQPENGCTLSISMVWWSRVTLLTWN